MLGSLVEDGKLKDKQRDELLQKYNEDLRRLQMKHSEGQLQYSLIFFRRYFQPFCTNLVQVYHQMQTSAYTSSILAFDICPQMLRKKCIIFFFHPPPHFSLQIIIKLAKHAGI